MNEIKLPSLLSFERKLETSDALMYSGKWNDIEAKQNQEENDLWKPIEITKRQNRSTQSAHGTKDEDKPKPNPVSSDSDDANLPPDSDTLKVEFTLRIIGNLGKPFASNDPNFENSIIEKVDAYKKEKGLEVLAFRYAYNIANGRFLWRNRVCAEKITICIRSNSELILKFDAYDFSLNDFETHSDHEDLSKLAKLIESGLAGNADEFVFLTVTAFVKLGNNQHVFPSQEMNMGEKKKVLFKLGDCAALHSVKIGNALRTIDDWYKDAQFPIAAEPFGAVTQRGQAFRKSKIDLYSLMVKWVNEGENTTLSPNDKHFVIANLIRGGVFSKEKEN